jgi:4-hydroxybenzoate polyprenyltransferase
LEAALSFVTESQLWVAAAVTSLSAYAARQLQVARPGPALLAVFFSTLFIYNLDKSLDLGKNPGSTRATRARWLAGAAASSLVLTLASGPLQTIWVVLSGCGICSLYAVPLGSKGLRLKDVPGTKSLFVGLSVASAVLLVPLAHAGEIHVTGSTLWLFSFVATLTTLNATLFDIRDLTQDRAAGLSSLPVLLGATRTRAVLLVVALLGFGCVVRWAPQLRAEAAMSWMLCTLFCFLLTPNSPRAAYAWLVDGALFVPWLFG